FNGSMVMRTWPARTRSPDFTRIFVSMPSTCGWMLAERRDLIVATYSSVRGTGERLTVSTFTGRACAAGCLASVFAHPLLNKIAPQRAATQPSPRTFVSFFMSSDSNTLLQKMQRAAVRIHNWPALMPDFGD